MTGLVVQLLRQHFSDGHNIGEPSLRGTLWRTTNPTGIVIESSTKWDPSKGGQLPAIVVKRNDYAFQRFGINDQLMGGYGDDNSGAEWYTTFVIGSHTIFCLATEGAEAEVLGAETYFELLDFGPLFRRNFCLHRWVVQGVGAVHYLAEAAGAYFVPVTISYAFEQVWKLRPDAPLLKKIGIRTVIDSAK
jgi:hypothetical protein